MRGAAHRDFVGQNTTLARAHSEQFGRVISLEAVLIPSIVPRHLRASSVPTVQHRDSTATARNSEIEPLLTMP
jgi:hypothetical protein